MLGWACAGWMSIKGWTPMVSRLRAVEFLLLGSQACCLEEVFLSRIANMGWGAPTSLNMR